MFHQTAAVGLAPLLLAQGLYVRRTMEKLPEPPGPREGVTGAGPPLRLLVTGDSAAAGVGAPAQTRALLGRILHHLEPVYRVHWHLVAKTGATTRKTIDRLRASPTPCDVAVTSLGVNDVVAGLSAATWIRHQAELVAHLRDRSGARRIILSGLPPVHGFPALPQPLRWYLGARARRFDRELDRWAEAREDCEYLALDFALEPAHMAADGFHPGPEVYARWGHAVAERIRRR